MLFFWQKPPKTIRQISEELAENLLAHEKFQDGMSIVKDLITEDLSALTDDALKTDFEQRLGVPLERYLSPGKTIPSLRRLPIVEFFHVVVPALAAQFQERCAQHNIVMEVARVHQTSSNFGRTRDKIEDFRIGFRPAPAPRSAPS